MGTLLTKGFSDTQKELLGRDLDASRVKVREGRGGRSFSYLETHDVEDRANQIFGFDGWSAETVDMREVYTGKNRNGKTKVSYVAKVRITVFAGERVIVKEGTGYGDGVGEDIGEASELAVKESESDAEKRAFKKFGNAFGLALYDKDQERVRHGVDDEPIAADERQISTGGERRNPDDDFPGDRPAPGDDQSDNEADRAIAETRQRAADEADQLRARVERRAQERREKRNAATTKAAKFFPLPVFNDDTTKKDRADKWREWSRQIAAAIKAAANEDEARAVVTENKRGLLAFTKDVGTDAVLWAGDMIAKRWPGDDAQKDIDASLIITAPDVNTIDAWDRWLDELKAAIESAPNRASGAAVVTANQEEFDRASSILEMDVSAWARGKMDSRFGRPRASRSR